MPDKITVSELRDTNKISELCHSEDKPIFVTRSGVNDLVIMSIETYERLFEQLPMDVAITTAESDYESNGKLLNAKEILSQLRKKHFG